MSMLTARNRLGTPRLSAAAAHLDAGASRHAELTTAEILRAVDGLVLELERERNRLVSEAAAAGVFSSARGDSARTMIATVENFMVGTVSRMEARIRAAIEPEARTLAVRLHNAALKIVRAVRGFSPTDELMDDVTAQIKAAAADLASVGKVGSGVVVVVAVVVAVVVLATRKG